MWNLFMGNSESSENVSSCDESSPSQPPGVEEKSLERKAGDGEEVPAFQSSLPPDLLQKLPPIDPDVSLPLRESIPSSPLVLEIPRLKEKNPKKKTNREPKFVPYEPYKAAITPLVSHPSYLASKKPARNSASSEENQDTQQLRKEEEEQEDSSSSVRGSEEDCREVQELKDKLTEMERSLKIQLQVNSEVKKLLVASVGEDLEARVDFLTQDKARLAADLRQYANRISRDFEEKETLSVESNLWKSKFLACSLLVDDLARWKGCLVQANQDYEHTARVILHEHSVLWSTLLEALEILTDLNGAFDPLEETFQPAEAASLMGVSDYVLSVSKLLKKRLMKDLKSPETKVGSVKPCKIKTPGEEKIDSLLGNPLFSSSLNESDVYNKMACNAVKGAARVHLQTLKDKRSTPDFKKFKSCTHCQGSVQNI